jgi:hypothetical protein
VFVIITVLTASVQSVQGWWQKIPAAPPAEQVSLQIMCWLASIMLALTVVIALDAMRKWKSILGTPAANTPSSPLIETA